MAIGIFMPIYRPSPLFDVRGPGAFSTDFRNHHNPAGWSSVQGTLSLATGGSVSSNRLLLAMHGAQQHTEASWDAMPSVGTDDQEVLALFSYEGNKPNAEVVAAGPALKILGDDSISAGITRYVGVDRSARRSQLGSNIVVGSSAFTWSSGALYWTRLRIEAGRNQRRKVWAFGSAEPAFEDATPALNTWPTAPGKPGVITYGPDIDVVSLACSYICVAYNGATAVFP